MGRIQTKKQINYILSRIGTGGLMGVTVPTSTASSALEELTGVPHELSQRFVNELRRQELVVFTPEAKAMRLQLSVKGIHRLQSAEITNLSIPIPAKWDKKWRMVIFDIPARHKHQRYVFTSQLRRLGFVMIRDSTWFFPYPCIDALEKIIAHCGISSHVTIAEVSSLDVSTQKKLHRHFFETL